MTGLEAVRAIREAEAEAGSPAQRVLAMTANTQRRDREAALKAGMDGMLPKPIGKDTLQQTLARWLPGGES